MTIRLSLQHALHNFLAFTKDRHAPWWARLAVASGLALGVALLLVALSAILMGKADVSWWRSAISNNLLLGICAAAAMLLLLRAFAWLLPARWINALADMHDWRPILVASVILCVGAALGLRLGYALLTTIYQFDMWGKLSGLRMVQLKFAFFGVAILSANWVWWVMRAKERALAQQAAESQLRMLQAQIEPHFLFNTLANVQSLICTDPPRAELMLETFTDYLRASLDQMRVGDSTLAVELETAHNYLLLMQIRMGRRLTFSINASAEARLALLPPLLLQPLVENAVHHGLGPTLQGGSVVLDARVCDGILKITVDDDGAGLAQAARNPGAGVALANIHTRLETRFGRSAALVLTPLAQGTRAAMTLPFRPAT